MPTPSELSASDKITWHRYMDFYEPHLARLGRPERILEFGVFHGASIRYLRDRYHDAHIVGCDILPPQAEWPYDAAIEYVTLDQGEPADLERLFADHPDSFDLAIDDGSHQPEHQRNCLVATLPQVRSGGSYILEDLHTSHPEHEMVGRRSRNVTNCYHLLLAFEHLLSTGTPLTDVAVDRLTRKSLFTAEQVRGLFGAISSIDLYRRATLPLQCYNCGAVEFEYDRLRCTCGVAIAATADSMSAVVTVGSTRPVG
jgi:SAM-dependent methyltransferase